MSNGDTAILFEVYKATCAITKKSYIGFTSIGVVERWKQHVYYAFKPNRGISALHDAIRKYNVDNFDLKVIFTVVSRKQALKLEAESIVKHKTLSPLGYNLRE